MDSLLASIAIRFAASVAFRIRDAIFHPENADSQTAPAHSFRSDVRRCYPRGSLHVSPFRESQSAAILLNSRFTNSHLTTNDNREQSTRSNKESCKAERQANIERTTRKISHTQNHGILRSSLDESPQLAHNRHQSREQLLLLGCDRSRFAIARCRIAS